VKQPEQRSCHEDVPKRTHSDDQDSGMYCRR
jgi:hypothetical protein